nr:hypothetical protein CFP56_48929 [Quercus suber]
MFYISQKEKERNSASPAGVDRDSQAEFPGENRFSGELFKIGLAQVKRSRQVMDVAVGKLILRRNERHDGGLERKVLELDFAETWRRRRMNNGASGL